MEPIQKLVTLITASVIALGAFALVQAQSGVQASSETSKSWPCLEVHKLDYFIGTWQNSGEVKASEYGPEGKLSGTNRREWILGGFAQLLHHEEKNPSGNHTSVAIVGYDPEKKSYRSYSFGEGGRVSESEGTLEGNTWIWTGGFEMNGSRIRTRTVITPRSATSYDWKWQTARPDGDWLTVQEGTSTKTQ
jgi:hypothetical protein